MKKILFSFVILLLLLFTAGCSTSETHYETISPDEAKSMMNEGVQMIDVRTPDEYAQGHVPGAKLMPLQALENNLDELNKEERYLVICRSGARSAQASEILVQNGFKNIFSVNGGMNKWTYEVVK